jgi:hypothetical protein
VTGKRAFAIAWFHAGLCPGCGLPLTEIDCAGDGHLEDGTAFFYGHGGPATPLCSWTSDNLYSLCLIGSGKVKYHPGEGHGPRPRDCPDPVSSPSAIDRAGAHK